MPWTPLGSAFVGDDERSLGGEHTGEHGIIIRIATDRRRQRSCINELDDGQVIGEHATWSFVDEDQLLGGGRSGEHVGEFFEQRGEHQVGIKDDPHR